MTALLLTQVITALAVNCDSIARGEVTVVIGRQQVVSVVRRGRLSTHGSVRGKGEGPSCEIALFRELRRRCHPRERGKVAPPVHSYRSSALTGDKERNWESVVTKTRLAACSKLLLVYLLECHEILEFLHPSLFLSFKGMIVISNKRNKKLESQPD